MRNTSGGAHAAQVENVVASGPVDRWPLGQAAL